MGTLTLIIISSSLGTVFAQNGATQNEINSGRYSLADPNGSGIGEGSPSDDITKHPQYYSQNTSTQNPDIATASVGANILNGCNCVVFRMDDVQDYWLNDVQVAVMDQFVQKNEFLSVGPIVGYFGADSTVVNKAIAGYNSGLFEIYVHGWDHGDYSTYPLATQTLHFQDSQNKLQLLFL